MSRHENIQPLVEKNSSWNHNDHLLSPSSLLQKTKMYCFTFCKYQKGHSVPSCGGPSYIYTYVCVEEIGTWCRLESWSQRHSKAFVHRLLPRSQLEFHLFPHQNEMALIVGSDVWQEGGAGKQGKREGDAERNEEIDRWTGKETGSLQSSDTDKRWEEGRKRVSLLQIYDRT